MTHRRIRSSHPSAFDLGILFPRGYRVAFLYRTSGRRNVSLAREMNTWPGKCTSGQQKCASGEGNVQLARENRSGKCTYGEGNVHLLRKCAFCYRNVHLATKCTVGKEFTFDQGNIYLAMKYTHLVNENVHLVMEMCVWSRICIWW